MFKRVLFFGFLFLLTGLAFPQGKLFTIQEAVTGQARQFKPEAYDFVQAIPGSDDFSFVQKNGNAYDELKRISSTGEIKSIISLNDLNTKLKNGGQEPLSIFPLPYEWENESTIRFGTGEKLISVDVVSTSAAKVLANFGESPAYSFYNAKTGLSAFTKDNNLLVTKDGMGANPVTMDANKGIVNGSGYTHREEFGIHEGIFISPNGNYVAFYRKDETMVTDYPLVNSATRIAESHNIKYPMAGMTSENVTLGIYNPLNGLKVFVKTGEPKEQYLTAITWDPSEKFIYIGLLNRGQNHLKLNQYSAETGDFVKTLFEEKDSKWVEPENPLYFLKNNPTQFIWQSERDGYNQLYLYNTNGQLIKQLTTASEPVLQILGTDEKGENLFYETSADFGLSRKISRVNIKSAKSALLTPEKGTHSATLSANGNFLFIKYSSLGVPARTSVYNIKTGKSQNLLEAKNPYTEYAMPKAEFVNITAADGKTQLNGRIIKPTNFDANKKYPVMVYVYGGPHAQLVTDSWLGGAGLWDYYMAQKGFIVFTVDNRGSGNRGYAFENVIHRQLGQEEMKDQMKGVEYLKTLPFVDATRMGVFGWSFGGFMTTSLLTSYPDVFKVGVAGGPVIDWKWYEIMYGERYMDTPDENPDGYNITKLTDKAKNLKARLLMIHGAQDPVVVQQHSLEFVNACIKEGKQIDYFVYPDHEHNVRGKDRVHLMEKVADYFELHLKR
jgi:dipeptidyl-peptidase-4